jgi:hypothetical protein
MQNLQIIFFQQVDNDPASRDNINEVSAVVEAAGYLTFVFKERMTIYLAVDESNFEAAHDIVWRYWNKGEQ